MHKYFAFIWDPRDHTSTRQIASTRSTILSSATWEVAYENHGALVVQKPVHQRSPCVHSLSNRHGVIVGSLYPRTQNAGAAPVGDLSIYETRCVVESAGRHLVRNYWGSYIAVIYDPHSNGYSLLRDPTANLACFRAKTANIDILFSDLDDFRRYIQMPVSVNWQHITARLLAGFTLSRNCALNEVEDVPGGELLTISASTERRTTLWHPSEFCYEEGLDTADVAAQELRSTVLTAVHTLAHEHENVMVLLSGGLDSSIVTSCLAQQSVCRNVTCLNFYMSPESSTAPRNLAIPGLQGENLAKIRRVIGSADEREYARSVSERCGFTLCERERPVFDLDFERIFDAPLAPRPSGYAFLIDEDDIECEVAKAVRATACFAGQAGDTVFYATLRAIGALDYAFLHPLGAGIFREVFATACLSRESVPHVLAKVVKYGLLRAPLPAPIEPMKRPHLLRDEVADIVPANYFRHPWIDAASHLCPGKHDHVVGVARCVPLYHNTYYRERIAPSVHPLASQPVVETALRIPTYVLLAGGVSRGLARLAFKDLLPSKVVRRTVKGSGVSFQQNVVRRNVNSIREHLLDGILTKERLLDRRKLDACLTPEQPFLTVQPQQILDYVACEAWLSQVASWASHPITTQTLSDVLA